MTVIDALKLPGSYSFPWKFFAFLPPSFSWSTLFAYLVATLLFGCDPFNAASPRNTFLGARSPGKTFPNT